MYALIAQYYDLLHEELTEDIALVARLAEEIGGPVLDLGCGTGRLVLPLARAGQEVHGVDSCEEMLDIARAKLNNERFEVQNRAKFTHADLSDFKLEQQYGLAVLSYNTLLHLGSPALAFCLDNIRRHLIPGGALFVDVDNPADLHDPGQDGLLLLERVAVEPIRKETVILMISSVGDGARQIRDTVWIVDVSPTEGGALRRTVAHTTLYYYFAHQLQQILGTAGFELVAQYGDYDRQPYDNNSARLLIVATAR